MIEITFAGHRQPHPRPETVAGPATLVRAGGQVFLVDCGAWRFFSARAAVGVGARRVVGTAAHPFAQRPHRRSRRP